MTTPQDFDRLSAYLDKQLSPAEKAGLETRLEREPELKAALDDLRMTVRALRSLPAVKPPRNFTISQAQARPPPPPPRREPATQLHHLPGTGPRHRPATTSFPLAPAGDGAGGVCVCGRDRGRFRDESGQPGGSSGRPGDGRRAKERRPHPD